MHKIKHAKPTYFDYDLIVLGSGAGGGVAAHQAVQAGKKVALIEADKVGGECPNFGCVPTKALLQAADTYKTAKEGDRFGLKASNVSFDYKKIKAWKAAAVTHTGTEEGEAFYEHEGVDIVHGHGHFIDPWQISVDGKRFSAKQFLIASGTKNFVPPIAGLKEAGFITYREAIDLDSPPKSLFIIGGGAIGSEFAELFSSFDTKVHIADMAPRLVSQEDPEVGELLGALFERRGVSVHTGVKVTRVSKKGSKKTVYYEQNGKTHSVTVDEILLASGKVPNTDLGLENAGVKYDRSGVKVNGYMQTSNKHIYAAGDVVGPYKFTHTASYQSRIAAHNMFHRKNKRKADYHAIPRCVFTDPEIACVGYTESQLQDKKIKYQVAAVPITVIGRANTSGVDSGFVKVLAGKYGTLLGASVVSPQAGEVIHELTVAVQNHLTARQVAETVHAFPTWSEAVRKACQKLKSK
ncbi:MAG: dihydrolipoyl dehydrogenase [Candidatus Saccharibacteria bacterium]|nr:dihydrolipoyl dehydrogenase [Candidatus Saccharibacteria bacterium]